MKKWCPVFLVLVLVGVLPLIAVASPSAGQIERNIRKAIQVTFSNPPESQALFESSFQQALEMTRPQCSPATRELGFALACKCIHPAIFPEVRVAIDTYLALFPRGAHRKGVLVQKAILEYAEGGYEEAEKVLQEAVPLFSGRELAKLKTFQMNGLFTAHKYQTAGTYLQDWNDTKGTYQTRRNVRRWNKDSKAIQAALEKASSGDIDGVSAARTLRDALAHGYFAQKAPQAALGVIEAKDGLTPKIHGQDVSWLGMTRTIYHHLPAIQRYEKLVALVQNFPEADPQFRGQVLRSLWLVLRYELDRPTEAEKYLARLSDIPSFEGIAELEKLLSEINEHSLMTENGRRLVQRLDAFAPLLPYDNGMFPVVEKSLLSEIRLLTELLIGNPETLNQIHSKNPSGWTFRTIPVGLLYYIAGDLKMKAWTDYGLILPSLSSRDRRLLKDFLLPLYRKPTLSEWKLLGAFAAAEHFPTVAIDRLLEVLTLPHYDRPPQLNHALALLAELYQKNSAYIEAQSVWNTLRTLYPSSVWVR